MIEREEYERRSSELIKKASGDLINFRKMFDASTEGMIRMMLLLLYLKTTLPGIFNSIDDTSKLAAVWLALDSLEDSEAEIFAQMLREYEGTKQ
jgi:hypothetical protein